MIIDWLRKISGYYELEETLKIKTEELTLLRHDNYVLHNNFEELNEELINTEHKYAESKKKIEEMIRKETLNILELRGWYESRRNQNPWMYNGVRLGWQDVTTYLEPSNKEPFTELARTLIKNYDLNKKHEPSEIITSIYRYWNLRSSWTYVSDTVLHGRVEWWEDATDAIRIRRGDCETKAKCMYWTIDEALRLLGKSEHDWRLTFTASIVAGEGGHAYLTWLHDDGEYYVIESTYYERSSKYKTWLRTPMRFNNLYQDPWGFANKYRSWRSNNQTLLSFRD